MHALKKYDSIYAKILLALYRLAQYYADYFCFIPPESLVDMEAGLVHRQGLSFIQVTFETIRIWGESRMPPYTEMRQMLQEYLCIEILPSLNIPPYLVYEAGGIVESLYITDVIPDTGSGEDMPYHVTWDVLYINSPAAFDRYCELNGFSDKNVTYKHDYAQEYPAKGGINVQQG